MGVMGCFSFYPTKNLGGVGDGGMVVTDDEALAHRLRLLRNHGAEQRYFHKVVGGNFRLDSIQATVLQVKLKYLEGWHRARREHAERYRMLLGQTDLVERGAVALPENRDAAAGAPSPSRPRSSASRPPGSVYTHWISSLVWPSSASASSCTRRGPASSRARTRSCSECRPPCGPSGARGGISVASCGCRRGSGLACGGRNRASC